MKSVRGNGLIQPEPMSRERSRAGAGGVGNERKADVAGVQKGGSAAEAANNPLRGAVQHLHSEHPIRYDDHGPHHGGMDHERHRPAVAANAEHPFGKGGV